MVIKMQETISDYRLQGLYRRKLRENPADANLFKSQLYCGSKVLKFMGHKPAVYVLTNEIDSTFFGVTHCSNPWSCPVCSAKIMARQAAFIADGLDMMKKRGQIAFMVTFTIPHNKSMSCAETFEILQKTWAAFIQKGNKTEKIDYRGKEKRNVTITDVFSSFCVDTNCTRRIRVCEFTWGKNGWHPHYHCLFWVDSDKFDKASEWESRFIERWENIAWRTLEKVCLKARKTPEEWQKTRRWVKLFRQHLNQKKSCVQFSRDKNGKLIVQKSSDYICGWGADKELTGNYLKKASHRGHYTPHQILEMAFAADKRGDHDKCEFWLNLYMEFVRTTRKKLRSKFSNGFKNEIVQYRLTEKTITTETLKKKDTNSSAKWHVVCWFNEQQWCEIFLCLRQVNEQLLADILRRARHRDGKQQIEKLLLKYGIDIRNNGEHPDSMFIENRILA